MAPSEKHDVDIDAKSARCLCKRKWTLSGLSSSDLGYSLTAKWLFGSEECYVELREGGVYVDYYGKAQIWRPREKSKFEVALLGPGWQTCRRTGPLGKMNNQWAFKHTRQAQTLRHKREAST